MKVQNISLNSRDNQVMSKDLKLFKSFKCLMSKDFKLFRVLSVQTLACLPIESKTEFWPVRSKHIPGIETGTRVVFSQVPGISYCYKNGINFGHTKLVVSLIPLLLPVASLCTNTSFNFTQIAETKFCAISNCYETTLFQQRFWCT